MDQVLAIFVAGVLTGIAVSLIASGVVDQVFIVRYLRSHRRHRSGWDPTLKTGR